MKTITIPPLLRLSGRLSINIFLSSILISILSSFSLRAQESTFTIQGLIKNENNVLLDYATVSLINMQDSFVVRVVLSDEKGSYQFKNIKRGNYVIQARMLGYKDENSKQITLSLNSNSDYFVHDLVLIPSTTSLNEVVITVQKPLIERKADMLIVNVENSPLAAGNNALDILERSPGISVDKDDNISLQGKQGTLILIDGKETHFSASQLANLLRSTDGNTIQSLEIISNPSAKYDANGTAGIINIKLKKNKQIGTNGSVSLSGGYGNGHKTSNSLSLNHKNGRISLFGTYNYLNNKGAQDIGIYRLIGQETSFTSFDQLSKLNDQRNNNSVRAGIDYQISEKNILGFQVSANKTKRKTINSNTTSIGSYESLIDSVLKGSTLSQNKFSSYSISLNDTYSIDTLGRKITTVLDLSQFKDFNSADYGNYFFDMNDLILQEPILLRSNMPSTIRIQTAKMDYTHPLNKESKFEAVSSNFVPSDFSNCISPLIC